MAALIGDKFSVDPILVLKSSFTEWAIRVAAYRYIQAREEQAAARQRAQQASRAQRRHY